jgi:hypothetical protein
MILCIAAVLSACEGAPPVTPVTPDAAADDATVDGERTTDADTPSDGGSGPRDGGSTSPWDASPDAGDTGSGGPSDGGAVEAPVGPDVPAGCMFGRRPLVTDSPLPHASGRTESVRSGGFSDEYLYDATGAAKIGIRREWGGSVVFFGQSGSGPGTNRTNTIDANDTGREVQIALYDPDRTVQGCSWNGSCARSATCPLQIRYLGWNPVQGGNRCNIGSPIEGVSTDYGSLVATTVPLQWNPDWAARDCSADSCGMSGPASHPESDVRLTQTMRFITPRIVELRYTIENLTDVERRPTHQEMPTMYTANGHGGPDLWRLMDPNGTQIPIDTPSGGDGFFYENFTASAPWVSLQDDDLTYGVAILYENGLRDFQGWQKRDLPFNNVRSRIVFGLPARGAVHARAYLLLGSFETNRADAADLLARMPPFGVLDAPLGDVGSGPTTIRGWVLDNRGVSSIEARIDERVTVPLTHGGARPDVCRAWPGYPQCDRVGYSGTHDFGPPATCPHLVEIIATDSDGNRRTIAERLVYVR